MDDYGTSPERRWKGSTGKCFLSPSRSMVEKRTVGVAALSVSSGDIRITGEITDPRLAEVMMARDAPYFSAPKGVNRWQEGLFDGGD
jgi:hypothetical protein